MEEELQNRIRAVRRWKIDKTYQCPPKSAPVTYNDFTDEQKKVVKAVKTQLGYPKEVQNAIPLHAIVQGGGGTGKTALLLYLANLLRKELSKDQVIVAAYTGVSAHNIGAQTIHSAFKIKPFTPYEDLLNELDNYSQLLFDLGNVQFILLDEFSLISLDLFGYLDLLMRRARPFYSHLPFGGTSVILFGDIFQILPVSGLPVFVPLSSLSLDGDFLMTAAHSYRSFQRVFVFETPLRQQGESDDQIQFRHILSKIRIGKPDDLIAGLLATRVECKLSEEEKLKFGEALRVFETNKDVDEHNSITIAKKFRAEDIVSIRNSDHPLVDTFLDIAIGSVVMLTKNKHVGAGLVNGSTGFVRDVIFTSGSSLFYQNKRPPGDRIYAVIVDFKDYHGPLYAEGGGVSGVPILKVEETIELPDIRRPITVKRFPLRSSYALTKHKVVGLNLDRICIGFSNCQMFAGVDYVSLSRVKRLKDIMILDDASLTRLKARHSVALRGLLQQRHEEKRLINLTA